MYKLYSISDVVSMFPSDAKARDIENYIYEHGTYRQIGKNTKFLTEDDVKRLFDKLRGKKLKAEPPNDSPGLCVVLGGRRTGRPTDLVWVGWCPVGHELDLLDAVQLGAQERLRVQHTWDATVEEAAAFRSRNSGSSWYGQWFKRTPELNADIERTTASEPEQEG